MSVVNDAREFATAPAEYFGHSWHAMHHLERDELEELQLHAMRLRFEELRDRIPVLDRLASDQRIDAIDRREDIVGLLFQHTVFKSYPASLLVKSKFAPITKWLDRLTTHDLSQVDVSQCRSIDEWLDVLDSETELRVAHSSGTAGTMSFYPRGASEWRQMMDGIKCGLFQFSDPLDERDHSEDYFDLIWPLFRLGRSAITRFPEQALPVILGSPERLHALRDGRLSSDGMFLAGRLAAAEARGEVDQVDINPALIERRDDFVREQRELQGALDRFVNEMARELEGRRVWLLATWNTLFNMAQAGLDAGMESVFAADSLVSTGGGSKGQALPEDWEETVKRFMGVDRIQHAYAMTEMAALNRMCEHGRYHFEPWIVPFVLDPDSGELLPDEGEQTGRCAIFDLMAESYWGGTITGDRISLDRSPCTCGRTTPHAARTIERFSDQRGGDDKITCASSDEAHAKALDFLTDRLA